jgi:hypothetical protein
MEIQFDITVDVSQDFIDHSFYTEDGYRPSVKDIVHRVIEDIDGSHRFGISYEAKNVTIEELNVSEEG